MTGVGVVDWTSMTCGVSGTATPGTGPCHWGYVGGFSGWCLSPARSETRGTGPRHCKFGTPLLSRKVLELEC